MDFKEALKILGIEDYAERIFNSNSHGELFHLEQYVALAEYFQKQDRTDWDPQAWFRQWFISIVTYAEQNWERPESVFQHIEQMLRQQLEAAREPGDTTQ